jgi:hypothetical protein
MLWLNVETCSATIEGPAFEMAFNSRPLASDVSSNPSHAVQAKQLSFLIKWLVDMLL